MLLASGAFAGPDFALSETDLPAPETVLAAGEDLVALDSDTAAGLAFCGLLTCDFAPDAAALAAVVALVLATCLVAPAPDVSFVAFFAAGALALLELAVFELVVLTLAVLILVVLTAVAVAFASVVAGLLLAPFTIFAAAPCCFFAEAGLLAEAVLTLTAAFALVFLRIASLEPDVTAAALLCFAASAFLTEDFVSFSTFTSDLADFAADLTFDEVAFADDFELGIRTLS
jgi:hypothetical protein